MAILGTILGTILGLEVMAEKDAVTTMIVTNTETDYPMGVSSPEDALV